MNRQFKEFKESVKHMSREDLVRQLYLSTKTDEMQMIKEDIKIYMKQREERLQAKNPERQSSQLRAMFVDTDESLSMFPKVEEGADKHESQ